MLRAYRIIDGKGERKVPENKEKKDGNHRKKKIAEGGNYKLKKHHTLSCMVFFELRRQDLKNTPMTPIYQLLQETSQTQEKKIPK